MGAVKNASIPATRAPFTKTYPKVRAEELFGRIEAVHTDKVVEACCDVVAPTGEQGREWTREERVALLLDRVKHLEKVRCDALAAVDRLLILGIVY